MAGCETGGAPWRSLWSKEGRGMSSSLVPDAKPLAGPKQGLRKSSGSTRVCAMCVHVCADYPACCFFYSGVQEQTHRALRASGVAAAGGRVTGSALGHPYKRKCLSSV